jgi:hypothetical protein
MGEARFTPQEPCDLHLNARAPAAWAMGLALGVMGILAASATASPAANNTAVVEYRDTLKTYFGPARLIPVLFSSGEQVGDVYDVDTLQPYARRSDCFPRLQVQTTNGTLPVIGQLGNVDLGLSLGVGVIGSVSAGAGVAGVHRIAFINVTVESTTVKALQASLDTKRCPELRPIVREESPPHASAKHLMVIGEVYSGVRAIHVGLNKDAQVGVAVTQLEALLKRLGIHASAKVDAQAESARQIDVEGSVSEALAVRPAFVLVPQADVTLGGTTEARPGPPNAKRWEAYDPELPSQQGAFQALLHRAGSATQPQQSGPSTR